ncbi:MAG TPA: DUF4129 domain-containing protein [Anaerolineales bacterium]|nr:DUF4129 domain-containing protein [Anaerolineales bacterium]
MRSLFENKRLVLLLAVLGLGALTVLAVSLNGMPFREAQQFAQPEPQATQAPLTPIPEVQIEIPIWKQIVVLGLAAFLLVLLVLLLSPKWRKRLIWILVRAALWAVAIYFLLTRVGPLFPPQQQGDSGAPNASLTPMPVFEPPEVSPTFSYAVSFAFALLLLVLLWVLYRGWQKYMEMTSPSKSLQDIARIARSSLEDISAGRNSSDVIINCYLRMSDVVASRRKLQREAAMTPREFAARLQEAGLPGEPVMNLTRLFEGVRYGDRKSAPRDITEAVDCLKTILHYCGEPV